jgi:hypothetical protein
MILDGEHIRRHSPMLETRALQPALGKAGEHQANPRTRTFRIRILGDRLDGRCRFDRIGVNGQEITKYLLRIEADFLGVGTYVSAAEQSAWPARDVIALETLEQGRIDLRLFGNRCQRHPLTFTLQAKPGA